MFKKNKKYILDGGGGQTLLEMGLRPEGALWSATALINKNLNSLVVNMHTDFINAGSELIVTTNFSVRKKRLIQYNKLNYFEEATNSAALLAKKAKENTGKNVLIAGSIPTQGIVYSAEIITNDKETYSGFYETAKILNPNVDLFYLDVLSRLKEIKIAFDAIKSFKKPILIGVHLLKNGLLPSNEKIEDLIPITKDINCCGIILACVSPEIIDISLPKLTKLNLPFGFKVNAFEGLILCGALDCFELKRSVMSHELQHFKELSKREVPWIQECKKRNKDFSLGQCINTMILENDWKDTKRPIYRKDRLHDLNSLIESLKNPGYHFDDSPSWLAQQEEKYLGIALTCTKIDEYDISNANCTCKEFVNGFNSTHGISIAAQIEGVREWKIKNGKSKGQKMAFITISDSSCSLDNTVIFSEEWLKFKQHFKEGAVLLLRGSRDKKRNSFLIKSVHKIKNIT